MIQQVLQDFGLSKNEVKVYLALLPMQRGCSSTIGARADMSRNTVRNVVKGLVKKGLAHEKSDGGTNFYKAEQPERLLHLLEERKNEISQKQSDLTQFMGLLRAMQNPTMQCPSVKYYEGKEGVIEIYEDMISTGEDIYCWTDSSKMYKILDDYIPKFVDKRVAAGITSYAIMPQNKTNIYYTEKEADQRTCRLAKDFEINGQIRVYGDKVAIMTFTGTDPVGFVFQGEIITSLFKSVFDQAWSALEES